VPVVTEVDHGVPPGPGDREDLVSWVGRDVSIRGDLGARYAGPDEGKTYEGQRPDAL
jgi:hypothetical protein